MGLSFEIVARQPGARARRGRLHTPHGVVETPAFMPVGTYGAVKGLRAADLEELGVQIVLGNAYHLAERPGADLVARRGGLHRFIGWSGPILTDSGGYQVLSLADHCEVDDDGVTFRSLLDGSRQRLTPESVIRVQARLDSDVAMVLDECVASPAERHVAERAVRRSQAWAERSVALRDELPGGLFGIVQGSVYPDLRQGHAEELASLDLDGYAVGGLSVGEDKARTWRMLEAAVDGLPEERPHYVMGMGTPADLVEGVFRGADLFDCVMPTRHGRNGTAFTSEGSINIRNARFAEDDRPLDPCCECSTCRRHSRAYIRHLDARGEMLAAILLSWHNVAHYLDTMRRIRQAIASSALADLRAALAGSTEGQS